MKVVIGYDGTPVRRSIFSNLNFESPSYLMFPQPATMPDPLSMKSRMLGKQMGRTVGSMSNLIGTFRLRMATS